MSKNIDVLFVISHEPDIRYIKRFELLSKIFSVGVIYWNKSNHCKNFTMKDLWVREVKILADQVEPMRRITETIRYIRIAYREALKLNPKCVYVGNLDMLMVAANYKKRNPQSKIIYEIADLHRLIIDKQYSWNKKMISALVKMEERRLSGLVDCLVLTSMKFYDVHYKEFIRQDKVVFMPNMPNKNMFDDFSKKKHNKFTVGFIGWIRYKEQLKMLIDSAETAGVDVLFAGGDKEDAEFKEYCKKFSHCTVFGEFDYLTQIQEMYQKVDCIYAVYNADMNNVKVALPNKLYEAILCELPIIVAKHTYLEEIVLSMGIGVAVDHKKGIELTEVLKRLSTDNEYYETLCNNCRSQKEKVSLDKYNNALLQKIKLMEENNE